MKGQHVIVVGGGVIGTACAYYLRRAGWSVTIVDQGQHGQACSSGNCGLIVPSHVLPLAEPGAIKKTLKASLKRDAPFYIKPRLDLALWRWFYRFARRCNTPCMLESARARAALLNSSKQLFLEMVAQESLDCEWESQGCLFVYQTQAEMNKYAKTEALLRAEFGLPAERYDGEALTELEPALKPGLAGGWYFEMDAHMRPDKLMVSWRKKLESMQVAICENIRVTGLQSSEGRATSIQASGSELSADAFVIATGAWTPQLARVLGGRVPIQPGKGYSLTMPRPQLCPKIPLIFQEHKVVVTPMQSGYRLGSTMEFSGYDTRINPRRLDALKRGASHYLHQPHTQPIEQSWYGWRPMTYDGIPIIDRSPTFENVWVAAGHNMLGLSMATATGKLLTELIDARTPHVDPAPYSIQRF